MARKDVESRTEPTLRGVLASRINRSLAHGDWQKAREEAWSEAIADRVPPKKPAP